MINIINIILPRRPPPGAPAPGVEALWLPPPSHDKAWVPKAMGIDVEEREVWGIDAYTRRNIELALADAEPASLRMVPDEVRAFLEGELLPALNRQSDAHAHRISFALAELETNLIELRSTVSNARRDLPFIERRLAGVRAVQRAIVEWEAPDEEGIYLFHWII